jgi:hypothetical protein
MRFVHESTNNYEHMRAVQWIKQWLRAHESRLMNQAISKGTKVAFNDSCIVYGHMRAVEWIKQCLRAHGSRLMNQAVNKETKVPLVNKAMTTGTWMPINESSSDYGHMRIVHESRNNYEHTRAVQWIKHWIRAYERSSMYQTMTMGTWEKFNEPSSN